MTHATNVRKMMAQDGTQISCVNSCCVLCTGVISLYCTGNARSGFWLTNEGMNDIYST